MSNNLRQGALQFAAVLTLLCMGSFARSFASDFPTAKVEQLSVSEEGVGVAVNHGTVDARQEHHQHGASNMNHIFVNSPPPHEREKKSHEYFAQGEAFINKKPPNWDEAFEVFLFAANAEPPHPKACVRCAEYYHYKQNPPQIQEALYYYERAVSVSGPKPQDAYKGLLKLYYDLGMKGRKNKKVEFLQKAKDYGEKIDILDDESMLDDIDTQLSQLIISSTETSIPIATCVVAVNLIVREEESQEDTQKEREAAKQRQLDTEQRQQQDIAQRQLTGARSIEKPIPEIARDNEYIYRRFVGGKLIYKPDANSDAGRIEMPFADLSNPLEGTFDLSRCGEEWKHISIATGYRKAKKAANKDKLEVWIVPKFVLNKNIIMPYGLLSIFMSASGDAAPYLPIMTTDKWTSPVGIIWTSGNSDDMHFYDYLITRQFEEISSKNLYGNWGHARTYDRRYGIKERGELWESDSPFWGRKSIALGGITKRANQHSFVIEFEQI